MPGPFVADVLVGLREGLIFVGDDLDFRAPAIGGGGDESAGGGVPRARFEGAGRRAGDRADHAASGDVRPVGGGNLPVETDFG